MEPKIFSTEFAGKQLTAEFSPLAEQANGSVLVRYGETVVLATAVMGKAREGANFFPLTVDYEERFYAAGRILGSRFVRREARPSEEATLMARLIDHAIRPLFDQRIRNEIQVIVTALAVDEQNDPDVPAFIAASLALASSDIPWNGPIGCMRVVKKDDAYILNPTYEERSGAELDTFFSGKGASINMIEAGAKEAPEKDVGDALEKGIEELERIVAFQETIIAEVGKQKMAINLPEPTKELETLFKNNIRGRLEQALYVQEKKEWVAEMHTLKNEWFALVEASLPTTPQLATEGVFEQAIDDILTRNILDAPAGEEKRPDGRKLTDVRPLFVKTHITERNHGSGLFFRGQTHMLSLVTLGAPGDVLLVEGMEIREKRHFIHHYNFPPFSVGETGPMRGPGRREIGHGALAAKALRAIIPERTEFPYTIRVVSETLSSNGSSSMGAVCASSLALMDAGVPIKTPVAGIAMGLVTRKGSTAYKILTDIQGPEDYHGDMDFKAAGSRNGVTAIQMDVKIEGITIPMIRDILEQAKSARLTILDVIEKELPRSRSELSPYAPRIIQLTIKPEKIRDVIGPGGKVINEIINITGAQIDIEQDGSIFITGTDNGSAVRAKALIEEITHEYAVGERFTGRVTRIFPFGAMVEFVPNQEGLVHISELAPFRVEQVTDVVEPGDSVPVEIVSIDEQGRINLSIKKVATLEQKRGASDSPHTDRPQQRSRAGGHQRR